MVKVKPKYLIDMVPKVAEYFECSATQVDLRSIRAYSTKPIPLICPECGNRYQKTPRGICAGGVSCIKCTSIETKAPHLLDEWDYEKNVITPDRISYGSQKKVWWVCSKGHSWKTHPNRRTSGYGCPYCAGRGVCDENRLSSNHPRLMEEWDFEKNEIRPEEITYGSKKFVWWLCKECGYTWRACPNNRTNVDSGCPACSGRVVTDKNRLSILYPELCKEWHPTRNSGLTPDDVSYSSMKKVWWSCSECAHEWRSVINTRIKGHGCPACVGQVVSDKNRFSLLYPDTALDWHPTKNGSIKPTDVSFGSHKNIYWCCNTCGHEWQATVNSRTRGNGCAVCSTGPISRVSLRWVASLGLEGLVMEFYIKALKVRVDAYDPETNTVYEFLGDYWHGNPKLYNEKEVNPTVKKSYGYLYRRTMERLRSIEKAGYNIVYIWESDYLEEEKQRDKKEV